jgi:hypothetical protein
VTNPVLDAAVTWYRAGFTVLPTRSDGSKAPAVDWKAYQDHRPTPEETVQWATAAPGIGVLTGTEANLEMVEAEGRAVEEGQLDQVAEIAEASGLLDVWTKVLCGYSEVTPNGGIHWYYRVDGPARRNTKLASRPDPSDPTKRQVLWETRGEGGFSIVAPSSGSTHPTGRPWAVISGTPADIPTLTEAERDALYALLSMFDRMPARIEDERAPAPRPTDGTVRPGDDFNDRASWDDIIGKHGWTKVQRIGSGIGWRRPDKEGAGISATTGMAPDADRLYVFSTSTVFDTETPYSKFGAYALLEHGGDHAAAARALRLLGYGTPAPVVEEIVAWDRQKATPAPGEPLRAVPDPPAPKSTLERLLSDPALAEEVNLQLRRLDAKQIVAEVQAIRTPKPAADRGTLAELLSRPEQDSWRIQGLWPRGGRILLTAQRKCGKTTMVGNISKALIMGGDFLGQFAATKIEGRIAVLNYEVTGATFARWMNDVGVPPESMYVFNLRGCENPLSTDAGRVELAAQIREQGCTVLIVDPFGRAYSGADQNDAAMITPWLVSLDQVAEMAGCHELLLTAHAGWNGERTRGSSALEDWPDVIVTMTKGTGEDANTRYLRAEGRDVDVDEDALAYDDIRRTYRMTGDGSKKASAMQRRVTALTDVLVEKVRENPGLTKGAIFDLLRVDGVTWTNGDDSKAVAQGQSRGQLLVTDGGRNRKILHPVDLFKTPVTPVTPVTPTDPPEHSSGSPYVVGEPKGHSETPVTPISGEAG